MKDCLLNYAVEQCRCQAFFFPKTVRKNDSVRVCTLYEHSRCISPIITTFDYAPCSCVDSCESDFGDEFQMCTKKQNVSIKYISIMFTKYRIIWNNEYSLRAVSAYLWTSYGKIFYSIKTNKNLFQYANITKGSFMMYLIEDGDSERFFKALPICIFSQGG